MNKTQSLTIIASLLTINCGSFGPSMIISSPLTEQCSSAGLNDCENIVDGTIKAIEGDPKGKEILAKGLSSNMTKADKLAEFVQVFDTIKTLPGISGYVAPLNDIMSVISMAASKATNETSEEKSASNKVVNSKSNEAEAVPNDNLEECSKICVVSRSGDSAIYLCTECLNEHQRSIWTRTSVMLGLQNRLSSDCDQPY